MRATGKTRKAEIGHGARPPAPDFEVAALAIPPKETSYQISRFTAAVIAMQASEDRALVFLRRAHSFAQVAGKVGAAIRAAQRRDPEKQFIKRRIQHNGRETYAVWRVR